MIDKVKAILEKHNKLCQLEGSHGSDWFKGKYYLNGYSVQIFSENPLILFTNDEGFLFLDIDINDECILNVHGSSAADAETYLNELSEAIDNIYLREKQG